MESSERIRPFIEYAERIKTDQTISGKWKRKLLVVNRGFMRQVRIYDEALETLRGSKQVLEKISKGKITMEQYDIKMNHARQQVKEVEFFV